MYHVRIIRFIRVSGNHRQIFHGQIRRILLRSVYAYRSLGARAWGVDIVWQAPRPSYEGLRDAGYLPVNSQLPKPVHQAIGKHIHFAIVGRARVRIWLSLRINISLTIGEIYKMVEDFSTQFSSICPWNIWRLFPDTLYTYG